MTERTIVWFTFIILRRPSLLKKGWNPSSMWHWQCSSPCMAVCTSNPKTKEHHFMPLTYIEWIFRYLLDVKIAGMVDGFTISCVRWNYNFPGPHQHQMIWCPFLSMAPIRKKEFFPVHQIFPSKGIWCAASADTCQGIKPKSRFGWRGHLKKIFSPKEGASHFFISIPNCPSGT